MSDCDSELEYTKLERDNLLAQAADDARYIKQCEQTISELEKKLEGIERQQQLFMYRLLHIIEVASETAETNPAMKEVMELAGGKRDAEMIELGVVE